MGDQGRPLEKRADRGDVRAFESNLGEAVLGDPNVRPGLPHLLAQTLHLGHGQAGILRHHHHRSLGEDFVQGSDGFLLFRSIHGAFSGWREYPASCTCRVRPPQKKALGRDRLRLSPEPGSTPTAGQMVRTARAEELAQSSRPTQESVFPVYAGPLKTRSNRGRELSGASQAGRRARRQSRTGHGRTRPGRNPPRPPAYPPLTLPRSLTKGRARAKRKPLMIIRGRIAPPTPGGL
jgi:hypothetical protein